MIISRCLLCVFASRRLRVKTKNLKVRETWPLVVIVLSILVFGCGSKDTIRVTGQLVKDGKPYTAKLAGKEPETFGVDFVGTIKDRPYVFAATIDPSGAFRVEGPERRGIPRGQYKIAVLHSGYMGAGGDRFGARYAVEKTPLVVDLTQNTRLTVDVGAGTVSQ